MVNPIGNMVIKVDLDGSGFNRGVTGLNRQMRMVSRELSANLSQFSRYDNSLEKSKIKVDGLSKKQKVQAQITKELKDSYDKLSKETGENSAKTQAAAAKYNEAYAKLNQYERELNQATQELKDMQREQKALNSAMGKLGNNFNNFGPKLQEIGNSMKNVGRNMTMYVTAPVVAGFAVAAKKGIEFDDSMRKVKATSGATGEEFEALKKKAREMGATTKFSASDSAEALNYMALAGWDSKQMMEGLSGVMDLAAASGEDLGAVSDIVTDGLTAFGLKAKDSGHFADVLAQTSSKANTDVRGLGEAFKYVAPVAGALGYTIEDTSIAIGLMSNAGIKGEKAGTALRTMFTNLSSPTRAMGNEMERLGISITDSNGKMIPMRKLLGQLREKFKHLSKDQQASSAATIFGKEAMSGALAIINASDEDYQKLTKSIDSSTGASKRMADTMESGLGGKLRTLRSQFEELALTIYDRIEPALKIIVSAFSKVVTWITKLPASIQLAIVGFGLFAAVLGPLIFMFGLFVSVIGNAMAVLGPLLINAKKAGGIFAFLRTKIASLVKLFPILGVSISSLTLPITLIVGALVGIGIAFYQAYKRSETFRNIVNQAISGVANAFKAAKLALQGFFDLFKGDSKGAVTLEKIFPPETVSGIKNVVDTIRTTFFNVVDAIVGFAKEIGGQLASFWKENGAEITQALQNIAGFIKATFEFIFNFIIKPIMFAIWQVMQFIWPAIKYLIVSTWENIKGVIQGAINIILGIIKVFSSLFTGNWKGVWDGIVMILKGTVQLIWNLIQLWFVGKILGVVRYFGGLLKGLISGIWGVIKGIFTKSLSAIWNATKSIFGFLFNSVKSIFTNMKNWLSSTWNNIKSNTVGKAHSLFTGVRSKFTSLWNATKDIFTKLRNWMSNIWNSIKDNTVGIAGRLWDRVRNIFGSMRDGLKSIIGKIKDHIGGMVDAVKRGLNKLIEGLNWVGGKLGMDKIPKLHTGTEHTHTTTRLVKNGKIARDTFATVGDKGRGNGPNGFRNEMIEYPNGKRVLTPNRDTTAYLPKGSKVYNGAQTYSMLNGTLPRFSIGTVWKDIKSGASSAFNWTKNQIGKGTKWLGDKVGDVLDFMENPGKLLNYILEAFGIDFSSLTKGMGIAGDITRAAWSKIKKSATNWIKENLEAMGGGDLVGGILDPDKINYHYGHTAAYTAATGRPFHEGVDFPFVYQEVRTPMGGRLTRMPFMHGGYGNYVKITSGVIDMLFAHLKNFSKSPASGTMVKPGDVVGLTGNTGFSTGPHLHFEMRRNGRHFDPEPYLRNAKKKGRLSVGGGGATSGSGAAYASRIIRQAQSILGGRYKSRWIHDQMMRVAKRESNYQSNAVNNWDINAQRGDPSKGLFQIIGSTFRANAKSGYTNFNNPVHQGISAMQYIVRRYGWSGFKRAGDYAYATGGKVYNGLYHLGEEGYPEWIIPTDPSRANEAHKLLALAANDIDNRSKNKRPNNLPNPNVNNSDTNYIKTLENKLNTVINCLVSLVESNQAIADKESNVIIDETSFDKKVNSSIDKRERHEATRAKFRKGGAII
ncbi:phage tail tape measure protein [Staphylococcus aureus]|uniref:phage tail tape measure protein n=3 Tax=Staphylococcus aureus TaxID=1280 RepID=UPI000975D355|nr:phage tail tape measure protein [Staphylococcus aureus]MDG6742485.1 phage tail tape measure protein [Staphylococcus aureus]MDG6748436.1 phage tail tape measure protein [Staphylococcus aureus]MDG6750650.1 phage tail tape measure protein [Staphylococcus aureus]MDG6754063.1 phage tail tape measure protein [Staphylococcus aureus]MDG6756564.1 phage tail tape measure protein [Staphylococcus aureus]